MLLNITPFGWLHTLISLVSLCTGLYLLARHREIAWSRAGGRLYVAATAASCVSGLFIFRHGGFNEAHALSLLTLLVLAGAVWAERGATRGGLRHLGALLGFTLTVFFHFIPAYNETLVRLPVGAPYITGPDDPKLLPLIGGTFVVFLFVMFLQLLKLLRERRSTALLAGLFVLLALPVSAWAEPEDPLRLPVENFVTLPADVRHPEGIAADPATGEFYVGTFDAREPASTRNNVLLRYARDGRLLARRAFGPTPLTGVAFAQGHVYVLNFGASKLQRLPARFDAESPIVDVVAFSLLDPAAPSPRDVANPDGGVDRITFGRAGFPGINGMVFDRAGNLFVSDSLQGAVYRIDDATACAPCAVHVLSRDPLLGTAGSLPFGANGLALDADERWLYVNNAGDGRLLRMAPAGGAATVVAENMHGADGLQFHDGLLWLVANQADVILGVDEAGRTRVRAGELQGVDGEGRPRSLLFPASTAVQGEWMLATNLSLPLTPAAGDEWEESVRAWNIVRFRLPGTAPSSTIAAPTRYVQAGAHRFAYREVGPRGGIPLVLFNRLRGTLDDWDPAFVDRLAADRHVILFDHVGLSRSSGPLPTDYPGFAEGAAAFIRALGHEQIDALGFSFGGPVAMQMVLAHPDLVRRLVIAGSTPGFVPGDGPRNGPVPDKVWQTAFKPVNDDADFLYLFFSPSAASRAAGQAYRDRLKARPEAFDTPVSEAGWKAQIAAAQGIATPETTLLHRLGAIRQPVLVANGNDDIMTPTYGSYAMFQALPDARLVLYPDSGHGFLFQYPEAFAAEVSAFLR